MALTVGSFLLAILFFINAGTVLSEKRFLNRIGWSKSECERLPITSIKRQFVTALSAMRTILRLPLIVANILVIIFLLILG
jgi:immediate early response 3-interacting protein 1